MKEAGIVLALLVVGCAHDVTFKYSGVVTENTGTIVVKFSEAVRNASVTLNEKEVCSNKCTQKVTIKGVPAGDATLHVVASDSEWEKSIDEKHAVVVVAGEKRTIQVVTPPKGTGYWIYTAALVGVVVAIVLLN
jgi:hypothetical protein